MNPALYGSSSIISRPLSKIQKPLPEWDINDGGGEVHRIQPVELVIPDLNDNLFMRADFNGVCIDLARWKIQPVPPGRTLLDMRGANSTPANMLMSTMMIIYPRNIQDAHLTEHAERSYSHYIISNWGDIINGISITPQNMVDWAKYVKSWGFKVVYWNGQPQLYDKTLQALVDNQCIDWVIPGGEVDSKMKMEDFEAVLDNTLSVVSNGIPVGAHFTSNYPEGFPRDTFLPNWDKYDGRVHLCWQANDKESAGTQGARLYYARQRVNLGLVGGNGNPAPNSRVVAFEVQATSQLYGYDDEEYGCLRSLELLYTTRLDNRIRPMSGFGNGCRLRNGDRV